MSKADISLERISTKLNVLIALTLRKLTSETTFGTKSRGKRGTGDIARYLADCGLDAKEIAVIVGAPLASVRTLLSPHRRR